MNKLTQKPEDVKITEIRDRRQVSLENEVYENRKWALLNCIRQYPGHTEKWYADVMTLNHICARKTTLGIINDLVSGGSIKDDKIGNSFHSYTINHDDDYIVFNEMLNEFKSIEEEFLSYYDEVWNVFYDHTESIKKLGSKIWSVYDDQLNSQLTLLKALAVDVVGVLVKIYFDLMCKYDHVGDTSMVFAIFNIIRRVTPHDKKECLECFDHDLSMLEEHVELDSVGTFLHERGLTCEQLITKMIKFEHALKIKFLDGSSEDSADVSRKSDQSFIDNYFELNRPQPEVPQ
jgi:hypothetical protein